MAVRLLLLAAYVTGAAAAITHKPPLAVAAVCFLIAGGAQLWKRYSR